MKVIIKCVNIKHWDILGCFHYILNAPRIALGMQNVLLNSTYLKDFGMHLLQRSKEIAAFATPGGVFQYKIKPFGIKNLSITFQRLINMVIAGLHAS